MDNTDITEETLKDAIGRAREAAGIADAKEPRAESAYPLSWLEFMEIKLGWPKFRSNGKPQSQQEELHNKYREKL